MPERVFAGGTVRPECATGFPVVTKSFVMGDSILNDQSVYAFWMRQCHAKANRGAVVLHVEGVVAKPERFREVNHNLGVVVESVREALWVGPIAVAESRVVWRNKMEVTGETRKEGVEHP